MPAAAKLRIRFVQHPDKPCSSLSKSPPLRNSAANASTGLRASFDALGIDAFLVPRADEYQGEYVPACSERLAWLTGFTGSAGIALVTRSQAIVFVDGRYTTQLAEQVDGQCFTGGDLVGEPPHLWLTEACAPRDSGSASIRGCIPAPKCAGWKRRWPRSAARWSSCRTIRSTGCGPTGRPSRLEP